MKKRSGKLPCSRCGQEYIDEDIYAGLYWLETLTCMECYARLQQLPTDISCFGKPTITGAGKRRLAYDPEAPECREVCPDRNICLFVLSGKRPEGL